MIEEIEKENKKKMELCIQSFQNNIDNIRTNRVSPKILNNIYIEYFGAKTSLLSVSNITVENSHTLKINVFDHSITPLIRKSILNSRLDLNPVIKGKDILVPIPSLTEERRKKLVKIVRNYAENSRISIRNVRRDYNYKIKELFKKNMISEDNERSIQNKIQKMTNEHIKKIELMALNKEKDLMTF